MECTQKLECTQDLYESQCERTCPDQIGFLGICGTKYPVVRGPNKIGRDPQTCNIVLNLNSVSRQHAVINILSKKEFMLMDLDSANKTKLVDRTLKPYIPHPLKNGDTVQFGHVFGVFRLVEEETDLPMTQALDIPETPVFTKHASRLNNGPVTLVPESPDVSDKDDSFIVSSQTKPEKHSNNNFIKPSGKLIAIQPVGSKKIDNVYWTSSKKSSSLSLRLDDSNNSLNESKTPVKYQSSEENKSKNDIHEMDTQDQYPNKVKENGDTIHTVETQAPFDDNYVSIHELSTQAHNLDSFDPGKELHVHNVDTQLPDGMETLAKQDNKPLSSPSIYNLETQLPVPEKDNSPQLDENFAIDFNDSQLINDLETQDPCLLKHVSKICTVDDLKGQELCVDIASKSKHDSIFEAETQVECVNKEQKFSNDDITDGLVFDEMNTQPFYDGLDCKPLHTVETETKAMDNDSESNENTQEIKPLRRSVRIESDDSTDCEDICILPTQKIESKIPDDDLTDCEDDMFGSEINSVDKIGNAKNKLINTISIQDQPTQVLKEVDDNDDDLQDMLTQVIDEDVVKNTEEESNFEDLLTQKLDPVNENVPEELTVEITEKLPEKNHQNEQDTDKTNISPFKVPLASPLRSKRSSKSLTLKQDLIQKQELNKSFEDDDRYYKDTQDIFDDLCSQKNISTKNVILNPIRIEQAQMEGKLHVDIVAGSIESVNISEQHPNLDKNVSPINKYTSPFEQCNEKESVKSISSFSKDQVKVSTGSETQVTILQKTPSDPSDVEVTPKKLKPFRLMEIDLPNSQEIKTGVSFNCRSPVAGSSSESEVEQNDSEECTPILFKKKAKLPKASAKIDLIKKFDIEALPLRISTRTRKPTAKLQNGDGDASKGSKNILKSKFISEQEENIDNEIIIENITRLRNKAMRCKKDNISVESKNGKNKTKHMTDHVGGQAEVAVDSSVKKSEPKRRGRSRGNILKKCTQDAIVSEIINVINRRDSNSKCESGNNQTLSASKDSNKSLNSNSEKTKRSSGRRKNNSQKDKTNDVDKKRSSDPQKEDKLSKNITGSKKDVKSKNHEKEEQFTSESIKSEKQKRSNNKQPTIDIRDSVSPEKESEIRRSKRRRHKENNDKQDKIRDEQDKPRVDKEKGRRLEQSTVYNISSESGNDSPRNLKRSFTGEVELPSAKRTRSNVSANTSLRSTPARSAQKHFVLFTAFPCEEVRFKLEKLGAIIVTDVTKCTVLLTLNIKRTFKLLCAVGLGVPIVGPNWVQACSDTCMIVDPWLYLIKDEVAEKRFTFSLERTLTGKRSFLSGYNISSTPSVLPGQAEMKLIVESSGGTWKAEEPQWICVSCPADKSQWPSLRRKGAVIVSTEFILGGVLRQKLEIEKNKFK